MTNRTWNRRAHGGGFTLIELLLVITLILLMYVMAYGPAQKSYQEKKLLLCQKNLQMMDIALKIYGTDSRGSYPVTPGARTSEIPLSLLVPRYTSETEMFVCPGSADRSLPAAKPFTNRKISYAYYMGRTTNDSAEAALITDEQVNTLPRKPGDPIFSITGRRPGDNHRQFGGNLLFCDGHVQSSEARANLELPLTNGVVLLNPKP